MPVSCGILQACPTTFFVLPLSGVVNTNIYKTALPRLSVVPTSLLVTELEFGSLIQIITLSICFMDVV